MMKNILIGAAIAGVSITAYYCGLEWYEDYRRRHAYNPERNAWADRKERFYPSTSEESIDAYPEGCSTIVNGSVYQKPGRLYYPENPTQTVPSAFDIKTYHVKDNFDGVYYETAEEMWEAEARKDNDFSLQEKSSLDSLSAEPLALPCPTKPEEPEKVNSITQHFTSLELLSLEAKFLANHESDSISEASYSPRSSHSSVPTLTIEDEVLTEDSFSSVEVESLTFKKFGHLSKSDTQLHTWKQGKQDNTSDDFTNWLNTIFENTEYEKPISEDDANNKGSQACFLEDKACQLPEMSDSDDSFISTVEAFNIRPHRPRNMKMYEQAQELVSEDKVIYASYRPEMKYIESDEEYLAKVHCLRQGFQVMLQDETIRKWMIETSRSILTDIIQLSDRKEKQKEIDLFNSTFNRVVNYFIESEDRENLNYHLQTLGIAFPSFYDVVLRFLLLDIFYDIPSSNGFCGLPPEYEEDANLRIGVSKLLAWREKKPPDLHTNYPLYTMYNMCIYFFPIFTWGLLVRNSCLYEACLFFRSKILDYVERLFNFDYVRYTKPEHMADDLWLLSKEYLIRIERYVKKERQILRPYYRKLRYT